MPFEGASCDSAEVGPDDSVLGLPSPLVSMAMSYSAAAALDHWCQPLIAEGQGPVRAVAAQGAARLRLHTHRPDAGNALRVVLVGDAHE